jgi:hypothetical protein
LNPLTAHDGTAAAALEQLGGGVVPPPPPDVLVVVVEAEVLLGCVAVATQEQSVLTALSTAAAELIPHESITQLAAVFWMADAWAQSQEISPALQPWALAAELMQLVAHLGTAETSEAHWDCANAWLARASTKRRDFIVTQRGSGDRMKL